MSGVFLRLASKAKTVGAAVAAMATAVACFGLATPAQAIEVDYTNYLTKEAIEGSVKGVTNHNVTWNDEEGCAVFSGNASYLEIANPLTTADASTGFSIKAEVYISSENNNSGTYVKANGRTAAKNGWQRIFDLSNGTIRRYFFINAGTTAHMRTAFTVAGNGSEDQINLNNGKTYYDGWHTLELVVAPGGYATLYMDNEAVAYQSAGETTISVLNELSSYNTCYIGTSVFEATDAASDGFFIGKMKGFSIAPGTMKPTMCKISYVTNGGTEIEPAEATALPAELPTTTREGATFEGWYTDEACTIVAVPGAELTADVTLYAKWSHEHSWYFADDNNGVFSAHCTNDVLADDCDYYGEENALTLTVKDYKDPFSDEEKAAWEAAGLSLPTLSYRLSDGTYTTPENSGAASEGALPTKPGKYQLWIFKGGAVATYDFEIPESKKEEEKSDPKTDPKKQDKDADKKALPQTGDTAAPVAVVLGAACIALAAGLVVRAKRQ